jgi:hypothetical protein
MSAMRKPTPKVPEFYSINEVEKPLHNRVHHNNDACPSGRDIPQMNASQAQVATFTVKTASA